ncbi:MAG: ImmA/IrrE family metallo-endopeptidase [Pseudanabaena sp.]
MTKTEYISEATSPLSDRTIDITTFYQRLASLGLQRSYVKDILLPDWWCDDFEKQKGAVVEAAAYVSRRVGLDFKALLDPDKDLAFQEGRQPRYKLRKGTEKSNLAIARSMAERLADVAAYACEIPLQTVENLTAQTVRSQILQVSEFVTLTSILGFCWELGIPVVHVSKFPTVKGQKKFDGMVGEYSDRPVILIGNNRKSPAWLAFILAHELGHIICGHVKGSSIIDEHILDIDEHIDLDDDDKRQELEADRFAVELLFGRENARYDTPSNLSPVSLVNHAKDNAQKDRVNPASIVLNYAWFKEKMATTEKAKKSIWAITGEALKTFEDQPLTARQIINREMVKYLDWENLSSDNQELLERMTGLEEALLATY